MNKPKLIFFIVLFLGGIVSIKAQDIEQIGKKEPLKVNGGISANQVLYFSSDTVSYRDPYSYYLNGNLNFNIYGWDIPFSFTYSNQNHTFQQPFNQYCLHPKYKWISAHIGYSSMSFSPYSVNGHLYSGIGAELTPPGKVTVGFLFGRLRKAIPIDTSTQAPDPTLERWGYGVKTGVNVLSNENLTANIDFIVFHAKDRYSEKTVHIPDTVLTPEENLVVSFGGNFTVIKKIQLRAEYATSGITHNINSTEEVNNSKALSKLGNYFHTNNSSEYFNGYKINGAFTESNYSIGIGYERIDPGYQTFGGYYFNNDLENITLNGAVNLVDGKVSLGGNVGKQRDNLDDKKLSEMKRWVSAVNLSYTPGEKLTYNLSYSNFQSFTNIRSQFETINQLTPYDNLDTLNFTQLSENASFNVNYAIQSNDKQRQNANLNFNYQKADEKQGGKFVGEGSQFFNINTSYSFAYVPFNVTVTTALNTNINQAGDMDSKTIGPTLSINKMLFDKKLRTTLTNSLNKSFTNSIFTTRIWNTRLINSWRLKKKHNFNLSLVYMNRLSKQDKKDKKQNEFTGTLGYSYNF